MKIGRKVFQRLAIHFIQCLINLAWLTCFGYRFSGARCKESKRSHRELLIVIKSDKIVEAQPIYFWVPYPLRNRPNKKLKSPLTKIWGFLKKILNFWIFLKKVNYQKYCSKNHGWYLRLWKKIEKKILNKFFKNRKLGSSDQNQNIVSCLASY